MSADPVTDDLCSARRADSANQLKALTSKIDTGFKGVYKRQDDTNGKLAALNGSVARHESEIAVVKTTQGVQGRRLDTCETRVDSMRMTLAKKVGQGAAVVSVATLVAYILKLLLG